MMFFHYVNAITLQKFPYLSRSDQKNIDGLTHLNAIVK